MINTTLAFDVFGTLIDPNGIIPSLENMIGDSAHEFSRIWRDKQLEYSFRRGLMVDYHDFGVCTQQALEYAALACGTSLSDRQVESLLDDYLQLPAFSDVPEALAGLESRGYRLFAFSNGTPKAIEALLTNAGIRDYFQGLVSVDEVRSFKPDPAVYWHFLERAAAEAGTAWLISGNPFDVIGAMRAGMNTAWVKRDPAAIFDPWGREPTTIISSLLQLPPALQRFTDG